MRRALTALRRAVEFLVLLAILEVIVLAFSWGLWPSSTVGWIVLLTLGPVAYIVLDVASDLLLTPAVGYRLSRRRFSLKRVLVLLLFFLVSIGLCVGVALLAGLPLA